MFAFEIFEKSRSFAHFGQILIIFKKNSSRLRFSFLEAFFGFDGLQGL